MNKRNLQSKRALRSVLLVLLLSVVGLTKAFATYDFSAVCETGQTLYYNITNATNHYVELTCPGSNSWNGWNGFAKPTGNIILPENVQYNGVNYTVTSIGNYAFYYCQGLTGSLTIPNSVTSIGDASFHYCSGLTSVTIGNSVASIGYNPFSSCSDLEQIVVESSNTVYDSRGNCNAIIETATNTLISGCKNTVIPYSVTAIGLSAFAGCSGLAGNFTIPGFVTTIGEDAFCGCDGLTSIVLPYSVTSVEHAAFDQCSGLVAVYYTGDISQWCNIQFADFGFPEVWDDFLARAGGEVVGDFVSNPLYYAHNLYIGNELVTDLVIPETVTEIKPWTFINATCLTSLIVGNSVTSIGGSAFSGCSGLTSLTIGNSVISIGVDAFSYCSGLTGALIIPNSVTTLGFGAFDGCSGLTSLTIGNSLSTIEYGAFTFCSGLEQIVVEPGNTVFDSRENCNAIIETASNTLVIGCKNTVIPNTVTSISCEAFGGCTELASIEIPSSVTTIWDWAFYSCLGLTSMTVQSETPPTLYISTFLSCPNYIPVYVPCGSIEAYQNANGWNEFTNFIEMCPSEITATANPSEGGTISGAGTYDFGTAVTITASANDDYIFANWTENGEVVSSEPAYTFTVTGDRNLVANFGEITNFWTPNEEDYEDNMTFTCVVEIDGEEQRSTMLEVGAFCGEECRGSQRATYFAPTDRYIIQMTVFGEGNDVISFRLYDHQQQAELPLNPPAGVAFSNNGYGSLSTPYVLNFTSSVTHTQPLNNGWNWWSTYVELNNNDGLSQLENSIGSNGLVIKSRTNGYVEAYDDNGVTIWYGTLNSINNEQMYKIRTNAACEATVVGVPTVPENHPISINSGWNWIGFPCNQDVSVDVAMSNFTPENNDVIKGRTGFTTYYSDNNYNMWYGTLNTLEVGKGYMYRSNSTTQKTLVFQTGRGETTMENVTTEDNIFQPADGDFADNMTITAVLELDGEELQSEEYELAAFVGDECRGSVKLMYVEPVNRYVAFLTVFGEPSETLYFRLTDGTQTELSMDEITFAADGMEGTLSEPMTLRFGTTKLDENEWSKVLVYPNPSNGVFNIQGQGIRKIEVFNAFGQAVVSEETSNDHLQIDLSRYADGCYMLRVVTDNGISNRQLIKR